MKKTSITAPMLGVIALGFGLVWDVFFYQTAWGIVVPLFTLLFVGVVLVLDHFTRQRVGVQEGILLTLLVLTSLFFALRDSGMLMGLNILSMLGLGALLMARLNGARTDGYGLLRFAFIPFLDVVGESMAKSQVFRSVFGRARKMDVKIFRGILLALVIGLVFIVLFASADQVFRSFVERILLVEDLGTVIEHLFVIGCVGGAFLLLLAPAFWNPRERQEPEKLAGWSLPGMKSKEVSGGYQTEALIVLGVLNVIFLVFMWIQSVYLFGGQQNIEVFNITYAEYAREGFFDLLLVAGMVALVNWGLRSVAVGASRRVLLGMQTLLNALTFGVLVSSWMRLSLYEQAYGYSNDRILAHTVLIFVGCVLLLLVVESFKRWEDGRMLLTICCLASTILVGLNLANPDRLVAQHNIARGAEGYEVDAWHLMTLSDDAADVVGAYIHALLEEDAKMKKSPRGGGYTTGKGYPVYERPNIEAMRGWFFVEDDQQWQGWNLSRERAKWIKASIQQ